jgi:hypothetical protein
LWCALARLQRCRSFFEAFRRNDAIVTFTVFEPGERVRLRCGICLLCKNPFARRFISSL